MQTKIHRTVTRYRYPFLITAFFTIINIVLAFQYEPWRDVAQAWLIARDLPYSGILSTIHYDGHPALWYLILSLFAKAGCPFPAIFAISITLSMAGVWIFSLYAPFGMLEKFAFLFGTGFILNIPVIARNYALFPILIFGTALLYPKRHEKPLLYCILIALMLQTHVFLFGLAGALTMLFLGEWIAGIRKTRRGRNPADNNGSTVSGRHWLEFAGLVLIAVSLFLAYLELRTPPDGETAAIVQGSEAAKFLPISGDSGTSGESAGAKAILKALLVTPLEFINRLTNLEIWTDTSYWLGLLLILILVICAVLVDLKTAFILVMSYTWLYVVDVLIMPNYTDQKQASVFLIFVFCVWTACLRVRTPAVTASSRKSTAADPVSVTDSTDSPVKKTAVSDIENPAKGSVPGAAPKRRIVRRLRRPACRILLFSALFLSVMTWSTSATDIREQGYISTSAGKDAAAYIQAELPSGSVIAINNEVYTSSVAAWLPEDTIYNPIRNNHHGFGVWDSRVYTLYSDQGTLSELSQLVNDSYGTAGAADGISTWYFLCSLQDEDSVNEMIARSADKGDPERIEELQRWTNARNEENYILYRITVR